LRTALPSLADGVDKSIEMKNLAGRPHFGLEGAAGK
jgi:hypothetical protein